MTSEGEDGRAAGTAAGDGINELHDRAVEAGEPGYVDPATGLYVLTAAYLRDRGTCCGNGCRHCPY